MTGSNGLYLPQRLEHLRQLGLRQVRLDPDVPDPGALVARLLDDLEDHLLLGVPPDGAGTGLARLAPVQEAATLLCRCSATQ